MVLILVQHVALYCTQYLCSPLFCVDSKCVCPRCAVILIGVCEGSVPCMSQHQRLVHSVAWLIELQTSRSFTVHGEGPYWVCLLVESVY